jgi:hypothetical protein
VKLYLRKSTGQIHDGQKVVGVRCGRCAGTGRFITRVENGQPVGPGGECFRCEGKGWQTPEDEKRNEAYDQYAAAKAVRAMMNGQ